MHFLGVDVYWYCLKERTMDYKQLCRKICMLLCIITFFAGVGFAKSEADNSCCSFSLTSKYVVSCSSLMPVSTIKTSQDRRIRGFFEEEIVFQSNDKHIQNRLFSFLRLFYFCIALLIGTVLITGFFYNDTSVFAAKASLGIVLYIHRKDGSK